MSADDPAQSPRFARALHHIADVPRRDPRQRRVRVQEHRSAEPARAAVTQVVGQRLTSIRCQRQPIDPGTLAANHQLARPPVDVLEVQPGDLAAAQPQPRQQQHDRVVATADRCGAITAVKQQSDLPGCKPTGEILPRRRATDGTAAASGSAITSCAYRNRSSARNARTVISVDRAERRRASRNTNVLTSPPDDQPDHQPAALSAPTKTGSPGIDVDTVRVGLAS